MLHRTVVAERPTASRPGFVAACPCGWRIGEREVLPKAEARRLAKAHRRRTAAVIRSIAAQRTDAN